MKKLIVFMLPIILIIGCTDDVAIESADAENDDTQQSKDTDETSEPAETESNDAAENEEDESESTTASTESQTTENSTSESTKEAYIQELEQTELELAPLKTQAQNGTQTERNQAMQEIFTQWDDVLNDIYGSLEEQLSEGDMESLREEQHEWITHRDEAAEEEASKFEDGSLAPYEHANVMAQLTKERCYELVETYMHG